MTYQNPEPHELQRYYARRVPKPNPYYTDDPIWPGDPFWRSKKYPRELRASIAHEWHHSPDQPTLHQLAKKYNVPMSSLTTWCYAYPFGSRPMKRRSYFRRIENVLWGLRGPIADAQRNYFRERRNQIATSDATWLLMGDPLPSRSGLKSCFAHKSDKKITLPPLPSPKVSLDNDCST